MYKIINVLKIVLQSINITIIQMMIKILYQTYMLAQNMKIIVVNQLHIMELK